MKVRLIAASLAFAGASTGLLVAAGQPPAQEPARPPGLIFSSRVDLINVTATVYDDAGQFVEGLTQDDFVVYEDGVRQDVTQFSNERVPVSLGIAVDTSGSMAGEKIHAAESALNRFLYDLLGPDDEIFITAFSDEPRLAESWTSDRSLLSRALARLKPTGGTALYDAVAQAVPTAMRGQHQKKALVVISDGNDTSSRTRVTDLREAIRQSEVLVYAIGIDAESHPAAGTGSAPPRGPEPPRTPVPFPFPSDRRLPPPSTPPPTVWTSPSSPSEERVNVAALRDITDDSGGRTEIIRDARDLDPATAGIADELSRQYFLGYDTATGKDGKWHAIRVETRNPAYHVRARTGFMAN